MIVLAVFTDGRDDLLAQTLASAEEHLHGPVTSRVIFDDTGDLEHGEYLSHLYPRFCIVHHTHRLGFGGSIRDAWRYLQHRDEEFVLHVEDDFTFNRHVDLGDLTDALSDNPHLAQITLRRQPWNEAEIAAGGIVEQHPDDYVAVATGWCDWLEHRRFFSTNPSMYRRNLCDLGWPDAEHSEGVFTHQLLANGTPEASAAALRFAFWGRRDDLPWVTHIGRDRVGSGY